MEIRRTRAKTNRILWPENLKDRETFDRANSVRASFLNLSAEDSRRAVGIVDLIA